ncbi:MAG: hypothetical protein GX144_02235 [Clostridiaceae bacterium]|jgi:hypothetical protein|nr:hypothetical protein [Clostridiaceae bacterium]
MYTEEKNKAMQRKSVKKPRRKLVRKKRRKGRVNQVLLVLFALLYLPALWNWLFHGGIETEILDSGLLELSIPSEGVFIRQETVIKAPREGIIIPKVNSAERVPNQYEFAMLIDESSQVTLRSIEALEKDIIRQVAESFPTGLEDSPEFRDQVQKEVNKLSHMAIHKSPIDIKAVKTALERLLYQRNREVFDSRSDRIYLQNEKNELEQLRQNLSKNATMLLADFSALVVWDDRPYDERFHFENINSLTLDDLTVKGTDKQNKRNITQQQENNLGTVVAGDSFAVSKDQFFARLVNNEKSWYVCVVDSKKTDGLQVGNILTLKVENTDFLIPCTVESVQPMGDLSKVVLSFNRMIEKTIDLRYVHADLILESIKGLKVPIRSLTNRNTHDSTADIVLVRFNRAVTKRVTIIAQQDTFAVIDAVEGSSDTDPVSIFDIYVVNPQNIEEGQVID